jgi:hypothetical protein
MTTKIIQFINDTCCPRFGGNYNMNEEGHRVTQKEFIENMEKKIEDDDFSGDMKGLLRSGIEYDIREAYEFIKKEILEKL